MHKLVDFYKGYHFVKYYAKQNVCILLIKSYCFVLYCFVKDVLRLFCN